MDYIERIEALGACAPALDWLRSEQYPSLQAAWDACPLGDWLLWVLAAMGHPAYSDAQDAVLCSPEAQRAYEIVWSYDTSDEYWEALASDSEYWEALANLNTIKARVVREIVPIAPTL